MKIYIYVWYKSVSGIEHISVSGMTGRKVPSSGTDGNYKKTNY